MKKNTVLVVALFALMAVGAFAQTGTTGLAYASIDNGAAYSVSKGTVTTGAVVIPASYNGKPVTTIANDAFKGSTITGVTIPNSVKNIGSWAFFNCAKLTSVTIPASVISIGNQAFDACSSLTSVTFQGEISLGGIDSIAFGSNDGLRGVFYASPNSALGNPGTYTRPNGTSATWTKTGTTTAAPAANGTAGLVYRVDGNGYSVRKGTVKEGAVVIPATYDNKPVTVIYSAGFESTKITSVTIPSSVTLIMQYAFSDCQNLTSVTIGNGVKNIAEGAFTDCKSLTSVIIPASVTTIGNTVFEGCTALTSVTFQGTIDSGSFGSYNTFPGDLRAKYLAGGIGTYTRPNGTSTTWTKK